MPAVLAEEKAEGKKKRVIRRLAEPSQDPEEEATPATHAQEGQVEKSPARQSVGADQEEEEEESQVSVNLLTSPQSYSGTVRPTPPWHGH